MPEHLDLPDPFSGRCFKYRAFLAADTPFESDFPRRLLTLGELWFAKPSSLNDPFEFLPSTIGDEVRVPRRVVNNLGPNLKPAQRVRAIALAKRVLKSEGGKGIYREAADAQNAVFCCSLTVFNIQQWAYYANGHAGFAVELEVPTPTPPRIEHPLFFKVKYTNTRPAVDTDKFHDVKQSDYQARAGIAVAISKHRDWQHEQEVRGMSEGPQAIQRKHWMRGVYLGACINRADVVRVRNWLSDAELDLPIYRMTLHKSRYELIPKRIR